MVNVLTKHPYISKERYGKINRKNPLFKSSLFFLFNYGLFFL